MHFIIFLHVLLLWKQDIAESVRILDLQVSTDAVEGGETLLGCQFDMEGDMLYSVKWYKDGREFFRYVPRNIPSITSFMTPGVIVDFTRSSSNIVTLVQLDRESEGVYRCQVTGEYPNFSSVYMEKRISVYLLPRDSPKVTGLQNRYGIGDEVKLNCTSGPSRPEAILNWILNGKPAPTNYVEGPWYKISRHRNDAGYHKNHKGFRDKLELSDHTDVPIDSKLGLIFRVMPEHFVDGVLTIKCQATIAPLYQQETNFTYFLEIPTTANQNDASDNASTDEAVLSRKSLFLSFIIYCSLLAMIQF